MDPSKVYEELSAIRAEQARQGAVLEEHQRRSLAVEALHEDLQERMRPLEAHVERWAGAGKVLAVLGSVGGAIGLFLRFAG